jgi:hypothetical protein
MKTVKFKPGDWVIYRKRKASSAPGRRARDVNATARGELYDYLVDKYWIVQEMLADGQICLRTRRGKQHLMESGEPGLRKARRWERWWYGDRFRAVEQGTRENSQACDQQSD